MNVSGRGNCLCKSIGGKEAEQDMGCKVMAQRAQSRKGTCNENLAFVLEMGAMEDYM